MSIGCSVIRPPRKSIGYLSSQSIIQPFAYVWCKTGDFYSFIYLFIYLFILYLTFFNGSYYEYLWIIRWRVTNNWKKCKMSHSCLNFGKYLGIRIEKLRKIVKILHISWRKFNLRAYVQIVRTYEDIWGGHRHGRRERKISRNGERVSFSSKHILVQTTIMQ
jgi:hypothetical protein